MLLDELFICFGWTLNQNIYKFTKHWLKSPYHEHKSKSEPNTYVYVLHQIPSRWKKVYIDRLIRTHAATQLHTFQGAHHNGMSILKDVQKLNISLTLHEWLWRYETKICSKFALLQTWFYAISFDLLYILPPPWWIQSLSKHLRYQMDFSFFGEQCSCWIFRHKSASKVSRLILNK